MGYNNYADKNRAKRQELVREEIAAKCKVTHVIELANKIENAQDSLEVQKYKAAADIKLKLLAKYIPDLKSMELSQDPENPLFPQAIDSKMDSAEATRTYAESLRTH